MSDLQYGPEPFALVDLAKRVRYRNGWVFDVRHIERDPADTHGEAAGGWTLEILTKTANSYRDHVTCDACRSSVQDYRVMHLFPVPAATWTEADWLEWLMDRVEDVERHEAREFFRLSDYDTPVHADQTLTRPFAPNHGPGRDPYRRYSYATDEDRRTSFRGTVNA